MEPPPFTVDQIRQLRARLDEWIVTTPELDWRSDELAERLGKQTRISLKLELFQRTGTFKPRGALAVMLDMATEARARGVTAVSAGNHAIATAFAARALGISAKVVMLASANRARIERCRALGAEVEIAPDGGTAFARVEEIARNEGRTFVHPFEGPLTSLGTATLGLEWHVQTGPLDAVIIPIGGGGLCSGVGAAFRLLQPDCEVYGVEPEGAANMSRSFAAGEPVGMDKVATIADSLGPPYSLPYSFGLCREVISDIVQVDDDALCVGMDLLFREARLAVEPAAAASLAALLGPLRDRLTGKRVGIIACGANIDIASFSAQVERGQAISGRS